MGLLIELPARPTARSDDPQTKPLKRKLDHEQNLLPLAPQTSCRPRDSSLRTVLFSLPGAPTTAPAFSSTLFTP